MKKYFIVENNQQAGPFSIEELRAKAISAYTLVWFEGMANWQQADTIAELNSLFVTPLPPPLADNRQPNSVNPINKNRPTPNLGNSGTGLIVVAYLLAILGGAGGIITGAVLWMGKKKVDGENYKKYTPSSQLHGAFAFFLGIIVWAACVEMFLKG